MRQHRVLLQPLQEGEALLSGREALHLLQVLRVNVGAKLWVFDGQGYEAEAEVLEADPLRLRLRVAAPQASERELPFRLHIAAALLKGDSLSEVIRHSTELGMHRFVPLLSRYCQARSLSDNKHKRWQRIAAEAAKQCGRSVVPEVTTLQNLRDFQPRGLTIVAHPYASWTLASLQAAQPLSQQEAVTLLIGPEGGFSEEEIAMLEHHPNCYSVRLGARILRAETAPLALAAALVLPEAW